MILLGDRVAIEVDEFAETTESGLIIPGAEEPNTGTLYAIGTGATDLTDKQLSARVLFARGFGDMVKADGGEFLITDTGAVIMLLDE